MSVLDEILAGVREDLATRQSLVSLGALEAAAAAAPPAKPVLSAFAAPGLSIIAEVKRASPSKGELAEIADPAELAASYAAGSADAISVLTERRRFNGTLDDLDAVRARVSTPILRKDFMVADYQFYEARAHGADLVLLIVAALDDDQLTHFLELTKQLGMTALVETHDRDEASRAMDAGAQLIGVNNRNLKTLEVDLATFAPVAEHVGDAAVLVAESGISGPADAARLAGEGAQVLLVGEALVRSGNPVSAIRQLRQGQLGSPS